MMNEKLKTCIDNCHTEEECILCDKTHEKDIQNCPCGKNCQGLKTIIYNSIRNILFQLDVHAKSSTAQSWMTLQSLARNPLITKITNAVLKFKKMNSMNVLTTVTVRFVLKNVEMNIVWLYKIALVRKIARVSYIVIFYE